MEHIPEKDFEELRKMVNNENFQKYLEEYDKSLKSSTTPRQTVYKTKKREKKSIDLYRLSKLSVRVSLFAIVATVSINFGVNTYYDVKADDVAKKMVNIDNAYSFKYNGQSYIHMYDSIEIAHKILDYEGNKSIDAIIYSYFVNIEFNVEEVMNDVFKEMQSIIAYNTSNNIPISVEKMNSCNYSSLKDYITAKGFKDYDEYRKKMDRLLVAYEKEDLEKVSDIMGDINEEGIKR